MAPRIHPTHHPLFDGLSRPQRAAAASLLTVVDVAPGTMLGRQGRVAREFLLLLAGAVAVVVDGSPIALVRGGGHFGEVALLDRAVDSRRRAGFHALSDARVAVANRREFASLLRLSPVVAGRIGRGAVRRREYLDSLGGRRLAGVTGLRAG